MTGKSAERESCVLKYVPDKHTQEDVWKSC